MFKAVIYHNTATDDAGHPIHFGGWKPGHPLVRVFEDHGQHTDLRAPAVIADTYFRAFNADPDMLDDEGSRRLATAYRARRLRSLSTGDVVVINGTALACAPLGWTVIDAAAIREVDTPAHGSIPL